MATFKAILDKRYQLKDGTYPLKVRVYQGSGYSDMSLKIRLNKNDFDESRQTVKSDHPNKQLIELRILQVISAMQAQTIKFEMAEETYTAEMIKTRAFRPKPKLDIVQYGEKIALEMEETGRLGNAAAYRAAVCALKTYTGKNSIQFRELNYELLVSMENKMLRAGLKRNSIAAYNRGIRAIFNRAINADIVEAKYYPYRKYKVKIEGTAKRNISKEDIIKLVNLHIEPNNPLWHSRNYFLLSFNLRGISFSDMATLRLSDTSKGRLIYKRKKTRKVYDIKLTDMAIEILRQYENNGSNYLLPIIPSYITPKSEKERVFIQQAIKNCNKYLEKIGSDIGLDRRLTTYFSRHSWATIAKRMGYSKELISEALGHSLGSKITETYLDTFEQEIIDDMNEQVCKLS